MAKPETRGTPLRPMVIGEDGRAVAWVGSRARPGSLELATPQGSQMVTDAELEELAVALLLLARARREWNGP